MSYKEPQPHKNRETLAVNVTFAETKLPAPRKHPHETLTFHFTEKSLRQKHAPSPIYDNLDSACLETVSITYSAGLQRV